MRLVQPTLGQQAWPAPASRLQNPFIWPGPQPVNPEQAPLTQAWPAGQALPQAPQFCTSSMGWAQAPLAQHSPMVPSSARQNGSRSRVQSLPAQLPFTHTEFGPQLATQSSVGAGGRQELLSGSQIPEEHLLPQAPQFCGSSQSATQAVPHRPPRWVGPNWQSLRPGSCDPGTQDAPLQTCPGSHMWQPGP